MRNPSQAERADGEKSRRTRGRKGREGEMEKVGRQATANLVSASSGLVFLSHLRRLCVEEA